MRWRSVMTAVCYDVLNQVLFDKTVLSTSVFIVSPLSPSTKAGRWYVSVLVLWGVWGSALQWPAHPSGPRAQADHTLDSREPKSQECWPSKRTNINFIRPVDQSYSDWTTTAAAKSRTQWGCVWIQPPPPPPLLLLFHVADFFMNEKEVPVFPVLVGGGCSCSLFKPEDPVWDDMFGFSQQLNRSCVRGDGLQASADWLPVCSVCVCGGVTHRPV